MAVIVGSGVMYENKPVCHQFSVGSIEGAVLGSGKGLGVGEATQTGAAAPEEISPAPARVPSLKWTTIARYATGCHESRVKFPIVMATLAAPVASEVYVVVHGSFAVTPVSQ